MRAQSVVAGVAFVALSVACGRAHEGSRLTLGTLDGSGTASWRAACGTTVQEMQPCGTGSADNTGSCVPQAAQSGLAQAVEPVTSGLVCDNMWAVFADTHRRVTRICALEQRQNGLLTRGAITALVDLVAGQDGSTTARIVHDVLTQDSDRPELVGWIENAPNASMEHGEVRVNAPARPERACIESRPVK